MSMKQRTVSILLALALCLSLLPTAALAEEIPENTIPASESAQKPGVDGAVEAVRSAIDALPTAEEWADLTAEEQEAAAEDASAAYEAYEELTEAQQTALSGELEKLIALFDEINSEVAPLALGGKGTKDEPYVISDANDWVRVLSNAYPYYYLNNKFIKLNADIDLSGTTWNSKTLQNSTFDGQGHCIKNAGQPLFSSLSGSTVKNLAIVGAGITGSSTTGAGILANSATGTNTIANCYINGSVKFQCNNGNYGVGGMLGAVEESASVTIENSAIDATVENTGTGSDPRGAGGFVGIVKGSNVLTISNCYATGSVITGSKFAGGLVGAAPYTDRIITIKNSVALQSEVSNGNDKSYEGRIVSSATYFKTDNLTNNYAYADMIGAQQENKKYATGGINGSNVSKETCTTADFWKTTMHFDTGVWTIENGKLPRLKKLSAMTGNPPTYLLDAANCPVRLGDEDKSVAVTFQTTDADTAEKTDSITITNSGSDSDTLALDDFNISSSDSALVSISGLSVSALEGNTLTITMAKSVTAKKAYLFYQAYCLGEITLSKTVTKVALPAPTNAKWDTTVPGKATWGRVTNAAKYSVQLYKDGAAQGAAVEATENSYDFTSVIADTGSYTFKVKALGNDTYSDSTEATSDGAYTFTQQTLADVKTSAKVALDAMSVSNDTTADEVLNVVQGRITNKKIHAAWSTSDPFVKVNATDGENNGRTGSITGTIALTLDSTQETIAVNLTIKPKFAVTFASGSTSATGTAPTQETVTAGTEITLPANPYTYYGMNFTGWSDGTNTYQASESYTMPAHNVMFTAQWTNDVWDGTAKSTSLEGSGTAEDPYIIASGADLNYLSNLPSGQYCRGYYKLMADIDMGGHEFSPIYHLVGIFDGNGHKITNLQITGSGVYYGLFKEAGYSTGTVIKNLTLDASLTYTNTTTGGVLGLLVSYAENNLSIENCYVTGTINAGTYMQMCVGGLVGRIKDAKTTISQCYAGVTFTGGASNSTFGGLVGSCEGGIIENCYAIPNMSGVTAGSRGGITSSTGGTIQNCYAAGGVFSGAGISSNAASIRSCVSIFPEMRGSARIFSSSSSGCASKNYGFDGTIQRDSNGIVTPPAEQFAAGQAQGADATATQLKSFSFYKDTLGWSEDIWEIRSGYDFPVLKGQKAVPMLALNLTPSVVSVTLDKNSATLPCGGTVQLKATVDVKNGANRTVTWASSDPSKAVVDETGKVTIPENAASGSVTITAIAVADGSKTATCTITVDAGRHTLTAIKDPSNSGNSPSAVCTFYASAEDAQAGSNPIMTAKAGTKVFARITQMDKGDIVSSGTKVNGVSAARLNMSTIYFTMPCEDARVVFSCAEWLNATNYVWFVGSDWGTWGETVTYTTQNWKGNDHIGSLTITNIINGKLFDSFEIKGMTACDAAQETESSLTPNKKSSQDELKNPGDYFVDMTDTAHPVLYVYNDKPGTIMVDIKVKDDPDADYNITKEAASAGYYTLDKNSAKAGETVTATLTEAGIAAIGTNQSMTLDYYGGLLVVLFPGQFQKGTDGEWTTTFTMPAQDITTRAYASAKQNVTLTGVNKTVAYNGQPQTIDSAITATLGTTNLSEALQGRYEVTYDDRTTAPTDVGTYTCTVKLPANDPLYSGEMTKTVTLTIEKSTPKAPAAPRAQSRAESSITLAKPTAFADGSAIPKGYTMEYQCGDGNWQASPTFDGLKATTAYTFYARIKADNNTNASAESVGSTIYTLPAAPAADVATIDFAGEKISFDESKYEMSMDSSFASGKEITSGTSITAQIGQTVYIRVKAMNGDAASEATEVKIPARPDAPAPTINFKDETLAVSTGERYKIGSGDYTEGSGNAESITSSIPATGAAVTVTYYLKATPTAFKSAEKTLMIPTRPAAPAAPTAKTTQATSLTLEAVAGAEYKLGDGNWQTDTTFTGLTAHTEYTFSQRFAATGTEFASAPNRATLTTANKDTVTFTLPVAGQTFTYDKTGKTPGMATASAEGIQLEVQYTGTNGTAYNSAEAPVNAGTYQAVYKVPDSNPAYRGTSDPVAFTIGKRTITVKADDKSMTVNGTLPVFTVSYGNFADGDGAETVFATPATATTTADGKTTGSFEITVTAPTLTADAANNYEVAALEKGTLTVSQRSSSGGSTTYPVNTPGKAENGNVTVSPKNASKGSTVTITVKPDSGYQLDDLTVTDKNGKELKLTDKGNGKYTFTMPASKVEINATFTKEVETSPFSDVSTSAYYYEAVKWAKEKSITGGIGDGLFGPDQPCTRAQIVTFLWRAAGSPEPKTMSSFSDVSADSYYAKAVAWAVENGITVGTSSTTFSPDDTCTRAQSVTFLFRALGKLVDSKAKFSDVPADSYYANAVAWAVENGVTNGIGDGLFGPDNSCTRAQIVTFLFRAYQDK